MTQLCPHCGKKNRVPEGRQTNGAYHCGHCHHVLSVSGQAANGGKARSRSVAAPRTWFLRVLFAAITLYVAIIAVISISNALGPERWWFGSFNQYLPQWIWALPAVPLLPLTLLLPRRRGRRLPHPLTWITLLTLLWVAGPLMGFCWNFSHSAHSPRSEPLRVMTYNVKWGHGDSDAIAADILSTNPDLLLLQDSDGVLDGKIGTALKGWNIQVSGQYIVASHLPFSNLEAHDISFAGSQHHCVRFMLRLGNENVVVYTVHLLSPRLGLMSVRHRSVGGMEVNAENREDEARILAGYLRQERGPTILTGDLNASIQSRICRTLCAAGLRDAFSDAGSGYGYTYGANTRVGIPYVRIDHILVSSQWRVERCWVGNTQGSDHCPVIADLALSPRGR